MLVCRKERNLTLYIDLYHLILVTFLYLFGSCFLPSFFFFFIYLLIMLLQLSHFRPFTQLHPAHSLPSTFSPYSSCPWVILISSLASTFPTLFLPPLSIFHLSFMLFILCTFPPSLPLPTPY